jgi:hypothetical protein
MANVVYECTVNKWHQKREYQTAPSAVPTCCGKPMVRAQATPTPTPPKPQGPAAAAVPPVPKR